MSSELVEPARSAPIEEHFEVLSKLLEELYVPEVSTGFDKPIERTDFLHYIEINEPKFLEVLNLIKNNYDDFHSYENIHKFKRKILTKAVVIRGQHLSNQEWTTECTVEQSGVIVSKVLDLFRFSSLKEALIDDQCYIFKYILATMRPWLLKESWKKYPPAILCYHWVLEQVESPNLSDHLNIILPTALIITDDFESKNRKIGLKCLKHIVDNVGMTHLTWYNQDEVILKAIFPLFYEKDAEIIEPLVAVLVSLLKKKHPLRSHCSLQMNEYDDLIDIFLQNMVMEQRMVLRSAYLACLSDIISSRGLAMILHSKTIDIILDEYILEPTSCIQALSVLKTYVQVCWPRMDLHCSTFLPIICKVCLLVEEERVSAECLDTVLTVVNFLEGCCPDKVNSFFKVLRNTESLASVVTMLNI